MTLLLNSQFGKVIISSGLQGIPEEKTLIFSLQKAHGVGLIFLQQWGWNPSMAFWGTHPKNPNHIPWDSQSTIGRNPKYAIECNPSAVSTWIHGSKVKQDLSSLYLQCWLPVIYWLVAWIIFYVPFHIWDVILPIDALIFFKMVIAPPTSHCF